MHGAGNDFVVLDGVNHPIALTAAVVRHLADRRFGVGCDQVLLVEPATAAGADFRYRIFNADGTEVEQCGNGARCFARFVRAKGLTTKDRIAVDTIGGRIYPYVDGDGGISVDMGTPHFDPPAIPFTAPARAIVYDLDVTGTTITISALSMGNPHAVQIVADVAHAPVALQGPLIERHVRFPRGVNAGFMQIVDRNTIRLRVHERGVGETLACGSGACAAMVAGRQQGLLDDTVDVVLPGGTLRVSWAGEGQPVRLAGPAETVYEGTIELNQHDA